MAGEVTHSRGDRCSIKAVAWLGRQGEDELGALGEGLSGEAGMAIDAGSTSAWKAIVHGMAGRAAQAR